MRDVLMVGLMIAAIALFAAYVAFCDRVIGRVDAEASPRGIDAPKRDLEQAA